MVQGITDYRATGSAAIALSTGALDRTWLITTLRVKFNAAPSTSENLTITIDDGNGAVYDTIIYTVDPSSGSQTDILKEFTQKIPVFSGGKWDWMDCSDLYLDHSGFEQWKTEFYTVEGWNAETGYPRRETLKELGLAHIADLLETRGKLL